MARKLSMDDLSKRLQGMGHPKEKIDLLLRWERVRLPMNNQEAHSTSEKVQMHIVVHDPMDNRRILRSMTNSS